MGRNIFSKDEINDFKIAMALIYGREHISQFLLEQKLYTIAICLRLNSPEHEDTWVDIAETILNTKSWTHFKKFILKGLLRIEAYLEIKELGFDSIKLSEKEKTSIFI